jgi:hypothetical protein
MPDAMLGEEHVTVRFAAADGSAFPVAMSPGSEKKHKGG